MFNWSCPSETFDTAAEASWEILLDRCANVLAETAPSEFPQIREELNTWRGPIEQWLACSEGSQDDTSTQLSAPIVNEEWQVVEAHVWCAEQSATREGVHQQDWITQVLLASESKGVLPAWLNRRWAWASRCVMWYDRKRGSSPDRSDGASQGQAPVRNERAVRVPLALVNTSALRGGQIGWLVVELTPRLVPDSQPQLFRDPQGSLRPRLFRDFGKALDNAWAAATTLTGITDSDAFWYVEFDRPVKSVEGPSAGAAAARAFWYLLRRKVPDPGVIVIAGVHKDGGLFAVESSLEAKMEAIAGWQRDLEKKLLTDAPDTVVVVGDKRPAQAMLDRELRAKECVGRVLVRGL